MKKWVQSIAAIVFMVPAFAFASTEVTILWDEYTDSRVEGFRLYEKPEKGDFGGVVKEIPGYTTTQFVFRPEGLDKRCWALTAYVEDMESEFSNEACAVVRPDKPLRLRF